MELILILTVLAFLLLAVILFVGGWLFWETFLSSKGVITRSLNMSLFLISLPKRSIKEQTEEAKKEEKNLIAAMEQLYASLAYLHEKGSSVWKFGQPFVAFEIAVANVGEEIAFYLSAPRKYEEVVLKQIYGFFPQAYIERKKDYNIFNPTGVSRGSFLKQTKTYALPIKTYTKLDADPVNALITSLSQLQESNEGAAIQFIIMSADKGWEKKGHKIAKEMAKGHNYELAKIKGSRSKIMREFEFAMETIFAGKKKDDQKKPEEKMRSPHEDEVMKALDDKASKAGFETNIRIMVSAQTALRADEILSQIEGSFVQFGSPNLNSLKPVRVSGRKFRKLAFDFSFRLFNKKQASLLNTEELTSLFHFYTGFMEAPKVKFLRLKPAPPPLDIPREGLVIGKNSYRGTETIARLSRDDRRRHMYIIGQTGTGKTYMMENMIIQDIQNGEGVCIIDPHGEFSEHILAYVPKERMDDLIYFDPGDLKRPMGLNMLEYDPAHPEQKTFIVNEMLSIFDKLYNLKETGGPMFEQYFRNATNLVMDDPESGNTLLSIMRVFTDSKYRAYKLSKTSSVTVKNFWKEQAEKAGGDAALANVVPYVVSKFDVFVTNAYMRPIIGQEKSAFNFRDVMDNKKILLVNLAKGKLGDINANLLGLIIVGRLLIAALSRVDMPEEERKDFYLYIDEFQNFSTNSISTILSEARKYKLCLTMAHQFIAQLKEEIRDAVFGNVGSMACFRIGSDDAEYLVKQFAPVYNQEDLINIDNRNAYVKLLLGGQTSKPFNILTLPRPVGSAELANLLKEYSSTKYGKERSLIEKEIDLNFIKQYGI